MQKCLICNQQLHWQPTFRQLLSFRKLAIPVICNGCRETFKPIGKENQCRGCGRQRGYLCPDCKHWQEKVGFLLKNESLYEYNAAMKEYMHVYKFMGDYRLRQVFSNQLTSVVKHIHADLIIPIPIHERTWQTRGFNQVSGFLEQVPLNQQILLPREQVKRTPQSAKNREERLDTPQPFMLRHPELIEHQAVLLVDDVYTTGRTLYHAATLCHKARCRSVRSVTLAS